MKGQYILLTCILLLSCNNKKNELPYRNLDDFSTSSGFIYLNIKYQEDIYSIVIDNSGLYASINHYMFKNQLSKSVYENMISKAIIKNEYLEVNRELDTELRYFLVKKDLILRYDSIDIFNRSYISQNGMFKDSVDKENQRAIIYTLLKKGIRNCYKDSETGKPIVSNN